MEELKMELMNIVAQIEKEQLEARIKEELSSVGKKDLWKLVERCIEVGTAIRLYELVKD